jgi:hypothetical protein
MIYRVDKFQFTGVIKVAFRILSEFSTYPEQLYSRGYGIKAGLTNVRSIGCRQRSGRKSRLLNAPNSF